MLEVTEWKTQSSDTQIHGFFVFGAHLDGHSICMTAVTLLSSDHDCVQTADSEWLNSEVDIARILVKSFSKVPEVNSIFIRFQDDEFLVWTILDSYNREARDKIYDKELEIFDNLKLDNFDFRVTSSDLMSPDELDEAGYHKIFSRD